MEADLRRFAAATGTAVLVGRIANLYGPGQNLAKPQGLVSQLCLANLTGQPLSIYVSLDTLRDYLSTPPTWATWWPRRCPRCASGWRAYRCRSWSRWWPPAGA